VSRMTVPDIVTAPSAPTPIQTYTGPGSGPVGIPPSLASRTDLQDTWLAVPWNRSATNMPDGLQTLDWQDRKLLPPPAYEKSDWTLLTVAIDLSRSQNASEMLSPDRLTGEGAVRGIYF